MMDTLQRLGALFQEVFDDDELAITRETTAHDVEDDDELAITRETTAHDVEDWDSLMHVNLLLTVERWFEIYRFSSSEVAGLRSVGELVVGRIA